jgi:hypothetical protein
MMGGSDIKQPFNMAYDTAANVFEDTIKNPGHSIYKPATASTALAPKIGKELTGLANQERKQKAAMDSLRQMTTDQSRSIQNQIDAYKRESMRAVQTPEELVAKKKKKLLGMRKGIPSTFVGQNTTPNTVMPSAGGIGQSSYQPLIKTLLGQ